jgi:hypothetical protein
MRVGGRLPGFEKTARYGGVLENLHHGTKDNIPGDEWQDHDWDGFKKGCPCVEKAPAILYLSAASLDGLC